MQPVIRSALEVSDRQHKYALWLVHVDQRIRERFPEVAPNLSPQIRINPGRSAHIGNEAVYGVIVPLAQLLIFRRVAGQRLEEFSLRLWMEGMWLHRPTILRARAMTSSPGIALTFPLRISSRRRSASSAHNWSISGSGVSCSSTVRRSRSSASCSGCS